MSEYSSLSSEHKLQFQFLFSMLASQNELLYTDSKLGLNSWKVFENSLNSFMPLLNTSGGMAYWHVQGKSHGPGYAEYIDSLIVKQDERPND
jgi:hypothetical protein